MNTTQELLDCLELALQNFENDTMPRPAEIKRMREALQSARELLPTWESLLRDLGASIQNLRPHKNPTKKDIAAARAVSRRANAYVRLEENGANTLTHDLYERLELALAHFQQGTPPHPAQFQRMREAVRAAASHCEKVVDEFERQLQTAKPRKTYYTVVREAAKPKTIQVYTVRRENIKPKSYEQANS